jgi:hypothetical protein
MINLQEEEKEVYKNSYIEMEKLPFNEIGSLIIINSL